jgi:hypothetical protein
MYNEDIPSAVVKMYISYILCIVVCLMYKICLCLPERIATPKNYHCFIYLCFPFSVESQKLWIEMLSIFS